MSVVSGNGGALAEALKFYPYGLTRSLSGTDMTDKLFTGQRLDDTGLYYYGARYYDPTIGRFISADAVVQNPANPQTLNRYSYCVNNPLKYFDPSGLDYLLVGGSNSTVAQMATWKLQLMEAGAIKDGEAVYYRIDNDTEGIPGVGCDIETRLKQLDAWLSNPVDSDGNPVTVTDLKILGHSEGAATVGTYMANWVNGTGSVSSSANDLLNSQLRGVFLVDCPTGISGHFVANYDYMKLQGVGTNLRNRGIKTGNIYNSCSVVNFNPGALSDWGNYDVASWNDKLWNGLATVGTNYLVGLLITTPYNHNSAKADSAPVINGIMQN